MTKQELAAELSNRINVPRQESLSMINNLVDIISETLIGGDEVILRGFGTFRHVCRKERIGQDMCRKTTVVIPACNSIKFYPSELIKAKLNS